MRPFLLLSLLTLITVSAMAAEPADDRTRLSWIHIDGTVVARELVEGQPFEVTVEYELTAGPDAVLSLQGHGPWIDLPDGKYETTRHHVDYPGLNAQVTVQPGRGRQVFKFTTPKLFAHNSILWLAQFREAGGKTWPWHVRQGGGPLRRANPWFTLESGVPGNLFTYDQPVRFTLTPGTRIPQGTAMTAAWRVLGRDGAAVATGTAAFTVTGTGQQVPLDLDVKARGVFGLEVAIAGGETVNTTFGRIPDVLAATRGEPTRFGMHHIVRPAMPERLDQSMDMARRMGLTTCRMFVSWNNLQPARGEWRLEGWDRALDQAKAHGIISWFCLVDPPPWVMREGTSVRFQPFTFDEAAWRDTVTTLTRRWRGRVAGWEWLNEIVPGDAKDPVNTYLAFCRIGTEAAKAEDPAIQTALAGGLWPRNFRLGLLAAGVAKQVDVLPIHYGSGSGILEARADLEAAGIKAGILWDNETAHGISTWKMPLTEALAYRGQRDWIMEHWPDELAAGAACILYFGGSGDPAGNWDYAYEDLTPRPVAATLAVMAAKLHRAVPQGSFRLGDDGPFHLFAVGDHAVLVAPKARTAGASVPLMAGANALVVTDDQGEENRVTANGPAVALPLGEQAEWVEGGDLDVLRTYTVPELLTRQVALLAGREDQLRLHLNNRSDHPLTGTLTATLPAGWPAAAPVPFTLAAGETQWVEIPFRAAADTPAAEHRLQVVCRFENTRLPEVILPFTLAVSDPLTLGNLLANSGFEMVDATGRPQAWSLDKNSQAVAPENFQEGLGRRVLRMNGSTGWQRAAQTLDLAGGKSYLYTAWIKNRDKAAGSNIDQKFTHGPAKSLFTPQVFSAGSNSPDWQFVSCVYRAPENLAKASFVPVAKGNGEALYDNLRVTLYEGTAYAAEAMQVVRAPVIDGDLSDWAADAPIPLLGPGQTTIHDPAWKWAAENLRGVVRFAWDDRNLYLAAWVTDDVLNAPATGDRTPESDSLVLALHPGNRAAGDDARAYAYYLSPAAPGGGSGKHTLYRPATHCGGLSSGQLAKDSSVYELAIRRDGTRTFYEARLPWSELGLTGRTGTKLGCSLQLNDNDGRGRAAHLSWGSGLDPVWRPTAFGVLTLLPAP